jgi:hypothetical protein
LLVVKAERSRFEVRETHTGWGGGKDHMAGYFREGVPEGEGHPNLLRGVQDILGGKFDSEKLVLKTDYFG